MAFEDDENLRDLLRRVTEGMGAVGSAPDPGVDMMMNATKGASTIRPPKGPHTEFIGAPVNPDIETQPMIGGELTDRGDAARKVSQALLLASPLGPVGGSGSKIPGPLGGADLPSDRLGDSEGGEGRSGMDYDPGFAGPTTTPNVVRPSEPLGKPEPGAPSEQDLYYTVHSESQHHGVKNRLKHGLENALLLANPEGGNWKYGLGQLAGNLAAGIISPKSVDKVYDERVAKPRQQAEIAEADRETVKQAGLRKIAQEEEIRKGQIERGKQPNWIQFPNTETGHYGLYDPGSGKTQDTPIQLPPPTTGPRKYLKGADGSQWDFTDPAHPKQVIPGKADKPDKPPSGSEAKTIAGQAEEAGIDRAQLHADYAKGRPGRLADILGGQKVFEGLNNDLNSGDEQTKADAARRLAAAKKQFDDEIDADIDNQVKKHVGQRTIDILGTRGQPQPLPAPQQKTTPQPAQVRAGGKGPDPNTYAALLTNELRRQGKTDSDIQAELRRRGLSQ